MNNQIEQACRELEAIASNVDQVIDKLRRIEDLIYSSIPDISGIDDPAARAAAALAKQAHAEICNAEYGSLGDYLRNSRRLVTALRS